MVVSNDYMIYKKTTALIYLITLNGNLTSKYTVTVSMHLTFEHNYFNNDILKYFMRL